MAQAETQPNFDSMLQTFLVDLDGDGVPDAQTQAPAGTGGVMDKLGLERRGESTPDRTGLLNRIGQGAALIDYWTMGIPSTMAGLVNSAIPGQPFGDLGTIKSSAETARSDLARSGGADLLALPDAFMGSLGNVPANARSAAQMAGPAARQAGRLADSAIDPIYQAMPSNAVGSAGGKLTPATEMPSTWYRGSSNPDILSTDNKSGVWMSSDRDYASMYGPNVGQYKVDGRIAEIPYSDLFEILKNPEVLKQAQAEGASAARLVSHDRKNPDELVVFDRSKIISMVRKYGIAAAASTYGMDQVQQAMGETEPQNPLMQGY